MSDMSDRSGTSQSQESQSQGTPQSERPEQPQGPRRFVMPGDVYVRPGIDDRPDPDKVLTAQDKAAIARLAIRMPKATAEPTSDQSDLQATRMVTETAPAVAAATIDAAVPDPESAYLDMRDPVVAADGTRPSKTDVLRLKIGFVMAALLCAVPWAAATNTLVPQLIDLIDHAQAPVALCVLNALGALVAWFSQNYFAAVSDGTRSRFGRRTPWILVGGVLAALAMWGLGGLGGSASSVVIVVIMWCVLQLCYNVMLGPFLNAMSDRMPDKFRPSADSWYGAAIAVGQMLGGWVGVLFVGRVTGGIARCAALLLVGAVAAVLIWPAEKSSLEMRLPRNATREAFAALRLRSWAPGFRRVFWSRLFMMASVGAVVIVEFYVAKFVALADQVGSGDVTASAAVLVAWMGVVTLVVAVVGARVSGPIADRFGAWMPSACSAALVAVGALMPLVLPSRVGLLLFAAFAGFGFTLFNALGQELANAVLADPRDAGRALGTLNAASTLGTVLAAVVTGVTFALTGSFAWVFVLAIVMVLICEGFLVSVGGAVSR